MPLSRHSVGTYQEMSSYATHQGTLGHSRLSSLNHCGLILARRVNKCTRPCLHFLQNAQAGNELSTLSQNPHTPGKKPPPRRTEFRKVSFLALARACPAVLSPAPDLKKREPLTALDYKQRGTFISASAIPHRSTARVHVEGRNPDFRKKLSHSGLQNTEGSILVHLLYYEKVLIGHHLLLVLKIWRKKSTGPGSALHV